MTWRQSIWCYPIKHIRAIKTWLVRGHLDDEPPYEKLRDIANYCVLLAVFGEREEEILAQQEAA